MFKSYYDLTKPGIIYGNIITCTAGFLLASKGVINIFLLLETLLGLALVIASICTVNNYIDREIDVKMERTKNRPLVTGQITPFSALSFATILGLLGFLILFLYTNVVTASIALVGSFVYLVPYTWFKRNSIHGALVGTISGAVPPVVGYCAVTNNFDMGALILFLILVLWQMPHFYAIAIRRADDYAAAGIPVFPLKKGIETTKKYMVFYIILFIIAALMLAVFGYTGYIYAGIVLIVGLVWLYLCIKGFKVGTDDKVWARGVFLFSLVVMMTTFLAISISSLL